MDYQKD